MKMNGKVVFAMIVIYLIALGIIRTVIGPSSSDIAEAFLSDIYAVEQYEKDQFQLATDQLAFGSTGDGEQVVAEYMTTIKDTYGDYFSESGFEQFVLNRYAMTILQASIDDDFTAKVTEIKLEASKAESENTVYNFTVNIDILDSNSQIKNITESGYLNLVKGESGWVIDKLKLGVNNIYSH